jgi:hypothetical protein
VKLVRLDRGTAGEAPHADHPRPPWLSQKQQRATAPFGKTTSGGFGFVARPSRHHLDGRARLFRKAAQWLRNCARLSCESASPRPVEYLCYNTATMNEGMKGCIVPLLIRLHGVRLFVKLMGCESYRLHSGWSRPQVHWTRMEKSDGVRQLKSFAQSQMYNASLSLYCLALEPVSTSTQTRGR